MADEAQTVELTARPFKLYSLRVVPLWDSEAERFELGDDLRRIIDHIVRERSVGGLIGADLKPMRFCLLEEEDALYLPHTHQTYYTRERTPVWKVMVPASGIYSRETILSCIDRRSGRNAEKYENVLFLYPRAGAFYTFSNSEIRPVDESVFVIENQER